MRNTRMRFGWSETEIDEAIDNVRIALESGFIMDGEFTKKWKIYFTNVHNHEGVQFVNSCTMGLELLCRSIEGPPGKILTTANNWTSMPGAMIRAGWEPIFIDMNMVTLLPDPAHLEEMIVEYQPWLVEFPHLGGRIDPSIVDIRQICQKYSVALIEDHSHTLGVEEPDDWPHTDYTIRSMGALKYAGSGCGAVVTGKRDVIDRVARMSRYGRENEFGMAEEKEEASMEECFSARYNELSAAISWGFFRKFDFTAVMKQVQYYEEHLDTEKYKTYVGKYFNGYKFITAGMTLDRPIIQEAVQKADLNLGTGVWEYSLPDIYPNIECANTLPVTRSFTKYNFSLPTYPELPQECMEEFVEILNGLEP